MNFSFFVNLKTIFCAGNDCEINSTLENLDKINSDRKESNVYLEFACNPDNLKKNGM